jgi:hypothetical protein
MLPAPPTRTPLQALNEVLGSVDAVRNGPALYVLLGTFAVAGLLLAMAEGSLALNRGVWGAIEGGAALTAAFYGSNAAGLLVMDQAAGRVPRDVGDALRDALATAHRLVLVVLTVLCGGALLVAGLLVLLASARLPGVGPWLFALAVPVGVVLLGLAALALVAVIAPLAAPAIWDGRGVRDSLRFLAAQVRRRLIHAALLMSSVSLLTAAVGALVTFVVVSGGRAVAALSVLVVGIDVPPQTLMAGLFGHGLRSLGAAGAPMGSTGLAAGALIGGGVVFALALVLPGLVYLRGACAVYLSLSEELEAEDAQEPS